MRGRNDVDLVDDAHGTAARRGTTTTALLRRLRFVHRLDAVVRLLRLLQQHGQVRIDGHHQIQRDAVGLATGCRCRAHRSAVLALAGSRQVGGLRFGFGGAARRCRRWHQDDVRVDRERLGRLVQRDVQRLFRLRVVLALLVLAHGRQIETARR